MTVITKINENVLMHIQTRTKRQIHPKIYNIVVTNSALDKVQKSKRRS